jgi:hypothetical protein
MFRPLCLVAPIWCLSTRTGLKLFAVASVVVWGAIFTTIGRFSVGTPTAPSAEVGM